ncbi:RDD family protein [Jongsikchunia kroppenstedtii]|uniref:RDD family protein n=1 Tax=Jongsikchunia kroppenstedtii TaxID=1121721 RepID=UPI0003731E8D|nr:RDD family protein [Jongsikchunia kroppenstedtii]
MTDDPTAQPRVAGLVSRGLAAGIDLLVAVTIMAVGAGATIFLLFLIDVRNLDMSTSAWWFTTTAFLAICVVYLTGCWSLSGKTLGCVVMHLRVTGRRGQRLNLVRAVLRAVACTLFPIGLAWVAVSPGRRSLQDIVVGSRVVYADH